MTNDRRPSRLPVRGSLALALTFGGLTLLMAFRSPGDPAEDLLLAFDAGDGLGTAPDSSPALSPSVSASPGPSVSASPGPSLAASPSLSPSPTSSATASPEPTTAALTATGKAYQFRFGIVQVAVTMQGDQIVDVRALQLPDGDRHSASISQQVEPILREYALAADSADIDVVSGATYTSTAYAYSLQSALDQLTG
jgi:uncharacterized protein with FMN-binding domain